ncbi:MAG: DnaJ domain-containing protein [Spirochaetales bacterium]|nr:DnaJ domain-containing protein [Spirochaetales bacterium]
MHHRDLQIQKALFTVFGPSYNHQSIPEISLLKQAYRKRAMLFHPDRSKLTGMSELRLEEKFKKLSHAYNLLASLTQIKNNRAYSKQAHSMRMYRPKHFHAKHHHDYKYEKKVKVPCFRMRLAFFLYRKGIIDWNTTIEALIWQSSNRPRIGEIAVRCNYLKREHIYHILKNRIRGEKFCESAERIGLLDAFRTNVLLYLQRSYNFPIGRYFIERNILTEQEIERFVAELKEYNLRFKKKRHN